MTQIRNNDLIELVTTFLDVAETPDSPAGPRSETRKIQDFYKVAAQTHIEFSNRLIEAEAEFKTPASGDTEVPARLLTLRHVNNMTSVVVTMICLFTSQPNILPLENFEVFKGQFLNWFENSISRIVETSSTSLTGHA